MLQTEIHRLDGLRTTVQLHQINTRCVNLQQANPSRGVQVNTSVSKHPGGFESGYGGRIYATLLL